MGTVTFAPDANQGGGGSGGAVDSVAGRTGVVTLAKADVGLPNVDDTSDVGKPVSTAQQTALDAKTAFALSGTWASGKTAFASYTGKLARFSDVGLNGSTWYSDGSRWMHDGPIIMALNSEGYIVPSLSAANTATYSQSGTLITVTSIGHGIPNTSPNPAPNGKQCYLAFGSGLATTGWFKNFQYVSANSFTVDSTVSQSTTGIVNSNISEIIITPATVTIPGGVMGLFGMLQFTPVFEYTNSANNKIMKCKFGGTNISNRARTTTNHEMPYMEGQNRNSESSQYYPYGTYGNFYIAAVNNSFIDARNTVNNNDMSFSVQLASANEFIMLDKVNVILYPS